MTLTPNYLAEIPTVGTVEIPANPAGTKMAFARVGYSLEPAIADLIDNSIDAQASDVLVRLVYDRKGVHRVFIVDNGRGMSETLLTQAMQFGAELPHQPKDLGKYGIGLKAASLSQCKVFSVITCSHGNISGRRWSSESVGGDGDWNCDKLSLPACREMIAAPWATLNLRKSGTIVIWDELTGFKSGQSSPEDTVNRAIDSLTAHLGMVFHRFLSKKKIRIFLSSQFAGREQSKVIQPVEALNPFSYPKSGAQGFPKTFALSLEGVGKITLDAHIWPPRSKEPGYKLGRGKTAARQGFYFYRHNRLIQAGGWNGYRDDDAEPHLSLARVSVELPSSIDVSIQKDKVDNLPRDFIDAVRNASSGSTRFPDFIKKAGDVYRKKSSKSEQQDFPLVPRRGFTKSTQVAAQKYVAFDEGRTRKVDFRWKRLEAGKIFEIDRDRRRISLNELYRTAILSGRRRSQNDAQLFKIMLFLLIKDYLDYSAMTKTRIETLDNYNQLLLRSLDD